MKWFYRLLGVTLYSIATGERAGRRAWKERGDRTEARVDEGDLRAAAADRVG